MQGTLNVAVMQGGGISASFSWSVVFMLGMLAFTDRHAFHDHAFLQTAGRATESSKAARFVSIPEPSKGTARPQIWR
jgi:hypothetical protein